MLMVNVLSVFFSALYLLGLRRKQIPEAQNYTETTIYHAVVFENAPITLSKINYFYPPILCF